MQLPEILMAYLSLWSVSLSDMSDSATPWTTYSLPGCSVHRIFPGKNSEVGCHFFLQCMKVKIESEVVQSCPTLSDPMDSSLPGSSSKFPGHLQKQFAKGTTQKREVELFECHTKPNYYCDKQGLLSMKTVSVDI